MQLGGRFDVGSDFSRVAPEQLLIEIARVEEGLSEQERSQKRWTLTWLEGNPVFTLDGGPTLSVKAPED